MKVAKDLVVSLAYLVGIEDLVTVFGHHALLYCLCCLIISVICGSGNQESSRRIAAGTEP